MNDSNRVIVDAWNTVLYDKFCRFKHLVVEGLAQHSEAAFERCRYPEGARVLDVGCGFGDSTLRIARRVGPAGEAVGVDCAENFIRAAEADARNDGVDNARFIVADVQSGDLRGPYDHAFARFGTMFFEMPGAAMRNMRKALKPGGTLTQIVWRRREDNPWVHQAELRVRQIVPVVSHEETDQVHCGPGPFSMAGPDMVSTMLHGAGFERHRELDRLVDVAPARSSVLRERKARSASPRSWRRCGRRWRRLRDPTAYGRRRAPGSLRRPIPPEISSLRVQGPARPILKDDRRDDNACRILWRGGRNEAFNNAPLARRSGARLHCCRRDGR